MKRKYPQPALPTIYFRDDILSVPGYTFEKATLWNDAGSMTLLAEGSSLKDSANVLAKLAPAFSNGSLCLEREAHILRELKSNSDAMSTTLQILDFFTIPHANGNVVVLLLLHPGLNTLGRYLPPSKVNDLLLADVARIRPSSSHRDVYMMGMNEPDVEEMEAFDIMDLASFLEFAIQATHCVEVIHKAGVLHRELRANAFHLNAHSGLVRFVHFGNRAISLEQAGNPSELVFRAFDETEKVKVKEALCYLAPEQTGALETVSQDFRTDLYALGVLFWTLLVGRGVMPFEGEPMELLHAIVQKRPMPVHEVRRDVPQVVAAIIDKLLSKSPDHRYQSAHGLQVDLIHCQRLLLQSVSSAMDEAADLIPTFEIAKEDKFANFTIPVALFGRDKELETIRNVIRHTSTRFSRHLSATRGIISLASSTSTGTGTGDDDQQSTSSQRSASPGVGPGDGSPKITSSTLSPIAESSLPSSTATASESRDGRDGALRRVALNSQGRAPRAHCVVLSGTPGVGKSAIILSTQAKWRSHGLWGHAKFQDAHSAPFAALMSCMSSVLRQLMVFKTDLHRFVTTLQARLGPQVQNVPLLYQSAPEIQEILSLFDIQIAASLETLATEELRLRFQSLVLDVFTVLAEMRLFALVLDDIHDADDSSLELIKALVNSKSHMLIMMTVHSDKTERVNAVRSMFSSRSRVTWINLEPLSYPAIATMVSRCLHRSVEDCTPLSRFIYAASGGNAFSARNMLMSFQRHGLITFRWDQNNWQFDLAGVESSMADQKVVSDPSDLTFLLSHLRELDEDARKYLMWAVFFGATFKATEVSLMMDWEDASSGSGSSDDETEGSWKFQVAIENVRQSSPNRGSMRGLQIAISEGWIVQRARDMCTFAHDRYRQAAQAEADKLPQETIAKMSFRIILMKLHDTQPDVHGIAEHARRCLPLLLEHPKRDELLEVLLDAGESAWARGAHELALQSFSSAQSLLRSDRWEDNPSRTFTLLCRLAALHTWKGEYTSSDSLLHECLDRAVRPEEKAQILRLRSRNFWARNDYHSSLSDTVQALHILGIDVTASPSKREAENMFEQVKNEILAVGFNEIIAIPRSVDPKIDLTFLLLNDAGLNAYWATGADFGSVIGLTIIQVALRSGMSPGTASGFFWALEAAAEQRELFRFSTDLAKLAVHIAERHGNSQDKCRTEVLYTAMASGYENIHLRVHIPRLEQAWKYGNSAGDRVYAVFASLHAICIRLYVSDHINELIVAAEEFVSDLSLIIAGSDSIILAMGVLNCIRAIGGYTYADSPETAFDTASFKESDYVAQARETSGNVPLAMNWYNSFKLAGLFCLGFHDEAAALGFFVYETRNKHPNHRHVRFAMFFHSLALIACLRREDLEKDLASKYLRQVEMNQTYLRKWLSPSPVNNSTWIALVDAELASLQQHPDAFKLYDTAVKLAVNDDWLLEEGWALYLQGCHFVRCGVEGLGGELQRRGIARQSQWGAEGISKHLNAVLGPRTQHSLKRHTFTAEVGVQTESAGFTPQPQAVYGRGKTSEMDDVEISTLSAADLASVLQWSKDISSDINLTAALQRLTEIATESSGSQLTCVVIAREAGDYIVATTMTPPDYCQVYENPKSVRSISEPLQKTIIHHTLNSKERIYYADVATDARFSSEASQSIHRSVICIPIFSNRGQTFGAVYFASRYAFSQNTATTMTLLCQQASISIANSLLFRSVQTGTKENLKMISVQREALEVARRSREDALKATKIKSAFLASMSHELRTPFSSFYGLLDLLSGTELNPGQVEIVQTAMQSCELLLKIIDSILDYSKLEAAAVKLEFSGFAVENIIADCMELLLPSAAKKLDLSFNIEPDVPLWVVSDYARIRQVLMNLIGNAVKFTSGGHIKVTCGVDKTNAAPEGGVWLKFVIRDTGIGMSQNDIDQLFVPFHQADNSSTRRYGGTGLGLSISRELVHLMEGRIGVTSKLNVGSEFFFVIPVKLYDSDESRKAVAELQEFITALMHPRPLRILICSEADTTRSLLETMLQPFNVTSSSAIEEVKAQLRAVNPVSPSLDFLILDEQSDDLADELSRFLHSLNYHSLKNAKIIQLYTPTTTRLEGKTLFNSDIPGVVKMTKPLRHSRLLRILAGLKDVSSAMTASKVTDVARAMDNLAAVQRTLYGNVLIAEDNEISRNTLAKQLQKLQLNVVATENGEEAIAQWDRHGPGYFSVALFDHHMPICDGVEAAKRLRILESKRKASVLLPIVALSADCQESTKQLCLSAGMNAFLSKPLKKSDLISLLSMFGPSTSDI